MSLPQAFPSAWGNPEQGGDHVPGMTLRDYFAGQALAGLCANRSHIDGGSLAEQNGTVAIAYSIADAMLAERDK